MPITLFLADRNFDAETERAMGRAFEMVRAVLRLADVSDPVVKIVAEKIIELAQAGERDPNDLCNQTLSFFRETKRQEALNEP